MKNRPMSMIVYSLIVTFSCLVSPNAKAAIVWDSLAYQLPGNLVQMYSATWNTSGVDWLIYAAMGVKGNFNWPIGQSAATAWTEEGLNSGQTEYISWIWTGGAPLVNGEYKVFGLHKLIFVLPVSSVTKLSRDNITIGSGGGGQQN